MVNDAGEPKASTSLFFSGHTPADHPGEEESDTKADKGLDDEKLDEFFHIDETVRWIRENNYKRVALQLPDHFLVRAARIAQLIEAKAEAKIFILADTSYRRQFLLFSCCVDEVAAAHALCDAIVHYGDACLSALTENIPVK
ncbi:unnamed protein product [Heligmosomoides polygyrus]|uniref:2-(3-amino-3-carboxypropyl)histidine synthase subunit 2 n=1 Tax=Heligmosomoides polygyrus TaxID=6339 RepID=A0A183F7B9_HELPZ|nr:unnamed protein product [Heligmosomoides polygyrus]